jgi:hypothetical protein
MHAHTEFCSHVTHFSSPPFILLKSCLFSQQWFNSCPIVEWIFCR